MTPWLPFPFVSLGLCALWLMLNQTLDAANLLFGAALGIVMPLLTRALQALGYPRMRKPRVFARLMAMASVEIVRSCYNVSLIILWPNGRPINSQFIRVPLTLRDPHGLAFLSCLINMTPGTVWVEIFPEEHVLSLHVFDLHDTQWWIDTIKGSYEQPLIEIFETGNDNANTA